MAFTFNLATDVGKVRALVPDTDSTYPIFQDAEIQAFLDLEGDVRRGTALALETLASSQAYVLKQVTISGLSTSGPAVARELRERAKSLRDQALEAEGREGANFNWAEIVVNQFSWEERVWNEALRRQSP